MIPLENFIVDKDSAKNIPLIKNILLKKELLEKGDGRHKKIKTALVIGGGGMRAVYSSGVVTGLEKAGLSKVFDVVVGLSAGSAICAYFISGQSKLGTSIYQESLLDKNFINLTRISKILNVDYLDHVFRNVKPLNQKNIRSSRSEFYITVTDAKTGKGELLDTKDKEIDVIDAILASAALPIVYNKTILIKGKEYCDGAIGNGIPIDFLLAKGCTDILVVLNNSAVKKKSAPLFEKVGSILYMRKFTPQLRKATLARNHLYNKSLEIIQRLKNINVGFLTPEEMPLKRMSKDKAKMRKVEKMAEKQIERIFA